MLRRVRFRNVYRPRTGGDRRDRWRMLMKRLLLYTTTGCGGSRQLATSNPPSYRVIFLPNTNPNCSVTSVVSLGRSRCPSRSTLVAGTLHCSSTCHDTTSRRRVVASRAARRGDSRNRSGEGGWVPEPQSSLSCCLRGEP